MQIDPNKFWSKVQVGGDDECWPWLGRMDERGIPEFSLPRNKHKRAQRIAYELAYGHIPNRKKCHVTCHNVICCNPAHLTMEPFWMYVQRGDVETCWDWQGPTNDAGYGLYYTYDIDKHQKKSILSHRMSCILSGRFPDVNGRMIVRQMCGNKLCCNPDHLRCFSGFWSYIDVRGDDDCWEWLGAKDREGYGMWTVLPKRIMVHAHRYLWELEHGPIPAGIGYHGTCVCHRCDNPGCLNPKHLFIASHSGNMADRNTKGRAAHLCGEQNGNAKLTDGMVRQIRAMKGMGQREIGRLFGVSKTTIRDIQRGARWCHVQ